jgi:hypothetical protein
LKKALRYLRAFYFLFFSFYGTSISIKQATAQDLDTILKIRSGVGNLKHLEIQDIQKDIQEFVLAIINGTPVGLMRLFIPPTAPNTIEMGSFVKNHACNSTVSFYYAHTIRRVSSNARTEKTHCHYKQYTKSNSLLSSSVSEMAWVG